MATKRVYNENKTSYTDYDEKGNMKGAGIAGTENMATNGGLRMVSSGSYDDKTGNYTIKNIGTGKTITGSGTRADYDKVYSSYGTSSGGGGGGGSGRSSSYSVGNYASDTANAIKKAQAAAMGSMKDAYADQLKATVGAYNTERAKIPGQVTTANNRASSQGMANAQKIRNTLSQMGLLQSGESASQQLGNDISTANNINANELYGNDLDAGYADKITAAQAQNAVNVNNAAYQYGRDAIADNMAAAQLATQLAQWQQEFNEQRSQNDFNNSIAEGGLTGYYNGTYYRNGIPTSAIPYYGSY